MAKAEKLLEFHPWKPRDQYQARVNPTDCAASVWPKDGRWSSHQCNMKGKHEYGGRLWCAIHHPPRTHARDEARRAEWKRKSDAQEARWNLAALQQKQATAALAALRQIADGHNDPRELAREVLAMVPE